MEVNTYPTIPLPSPPDIKAIVFGEKQDADKPVNVKMPYQDRTWAYYRNNMGGDNNQHNTFNDSFGTDVSPPMRVVRVNSQDKNTLRTATTQSSSRRSRNSSRRSKQRKKKKGAKGQTKKRRKKYDSDSSSSSSSSSDSDSDSSSSASSSSDPTRRKKRQSGKKRTANKRRGKSRRRDDSSSSSDSSSDSDSSTSSGSSDSYRRRVSRKKLASDPQKSQQMRKKRSKRLGLHTAGSDSDSDSDSSYQERKRQRNKGSSKGGRSQSASVSMTGEVTSSKGRGKGKKKNKSGTASTSSRQNSQSTRSKRCNKNKIMTESEHDSSSHVVEVVEDEEEGHTEVDAEIDAEIISMSEATDADRTQQSHRSSESEPRRGKRPESPKKERRGFFAWLFGKKDEKKAEEKPPERPNFSPSLSSHFRQSSLPRNNSLRASSHHRSVATGSILEAIPESEELDESSTADHAVQRGGDVELGKGSVHSARPGIEQEFWESIRSGMKDDPSTAGSGVVGSVGFWNGEEEKARKRKRRIRIIIGVICLSLVAGGVAAALVLLVFNDEDSAPTEASGGSPTMAPSLMPIATLPAPTPAPFTSPPTQLFQCEICGTGQGFEVPPENAFTVVQRPLQSSATCGELKESAEAGTISRTECAAWQIYVPGVCC